MPSLCSDCGCDRNGHRHKNSRQKSNSHSKTSDGELVSPEKTPINTASAESASKYEGRGKSGVGSDITRSGDSGRGSGKSSSSSDSKNAEDVVAAEREEGEVEEKADDEIDEDESETSDVNAPERANKQAGLVKQVH